MLEFSALDRLWDEGRIEVVGREHLLGARAAGQPVIVMGLHLGNWETIGPTIVELGFRGAKGFYQPPRSRFEHKIVVAARERYGAIMLPNGVTGARGAHRHLVEERGVFLIYADEERNGRVSAPLFGRPLPPRSPISSTSSVSPGRAGRRSSRPMPSGSAAPASASPICRRSSLPRMAPTPPPRSARMSSASTG